jgi:predicted enzyme related to lactoylglutathione lyase
VRLRQAVLAAAEIEPIERALTEALGLSEPFRDPGVGMFGLQNAVFALGDCFIEIVSPVQDDTAAGRYIERHGGDCGYMVMFDLEDLDGARERAEAEGVRVVWQIDLPDISGTHLHPADMRGAIVSIDSSRPFGTWRWGGPQWTERTGAGAEGQLVGVTIAVADPAAVAARWAHVLGVPRTRDSHAVLALDRAEVRFTEQRDERAQGLVEIAVSGVAGLPDGADGVEIAGVRLRALAPA